MGQVCVLESYCLEAVLEDIGGISAVTLVTTACHFYPSTSVSSLGGYSESSSHVLIWGRTMGRTKASAGVYRMLLGWCWGEQCWGAAVLQVAGEGLGCGLAASAQCLR